jgi:hypothetical protein
LKDDLILKEDVDPDISVEQTIVVKQTSFWGAEMPKKERKVKKMVISIWRNDEELPCVLGLSDLKKDFQAKLKFLSLNWKNKRENILKWPSRPNSLKKSLL